MPKATTPSFIVTRRLLTCRTMAMFLDKKMRIVERLYNVGVTHCIHLLHELKQDAWYQFAMQQRQLTNDNAEQKAWTKEIFAAAAAYGLTEYDIHAFLGKEKKAHYDNGIGINIVQKAGTALYASVKKAIFGKKLHYRKYGETSSFEDKTPKTGIIYKAASDSVCVMGRTIKLKTIRKTDSYMQQAMMHRIKYCRIVRRPHGQSHHYFVQFIMEGMSPGKIITKDAKVGVDPGVSTMTAYSGTKLSFIELSRNVDQYTKAILHLQRIYDHKLRINNPGCFREDGTFIKGKKIHRTKGMLRIQMKLKTAFHKRSEYIKQSNGYATNRLIEQGNHIIIEPMNYSALARRSKTLERQAKASIVYDKSGNVKSVHKYKNRKRFGHSILMHCPAAFVSTLASKAYKYGGYVEEVNIRTYRASQYNHSNNTYEKHLLSERTRKIGKSIVQRDCYSAFLLYHKLDSDTINRDACKADFRNFLNCQKKILQTGINNRNFGLILNQTA